MLDFTKSTLPRSPTFSERMRLTLVLLRMRLPMPGMWLPALWSSGAIVSSNLIAPLSVRLVIELENGDQSVELEIKSVTK